MGATCWGSVAAIMAAASALVSACASTSRSSSQAPAAQDLTGAWRGHSPRATYNFVLTQTGTRVTGTVNVQPGGGAYSGQLEGTIVGNAFTFRVGSIDGTYTIVNDNEMTGSSFVGATPIVLRRVR